MTLHPLETFDQAPPLRRRARNTGGLKVLPEKTNFAEELDAAGYTRSATRIHVQRFG
ncbi:hypothetical protein HanIR_Chr05g0240691 [Helianthus annuus]|nr:hypothetical protein HanIR_Chr05g0240691 [Helianthus annuus]